MSSCKCRTIAAVLLLLGLGALTLEFWRPWQDAGREDKRLTALEALAKEYVLKGARQPEEVTFEGWGPHDLDGRVVALALQTQEHAGSPSAGFEARLVDATFDRSRPVQVIRVLWTDRVHDSDLPTDSLVAIQDGKVVCCDHLSTSGRGDDWLRKTLAHLDYQRAVETASRHYQEAMKEPPPWRDEAKIRAELDAALKRARQQRDRAGQGP